MKIPLNSFMKKKKKKNQDRMTKGPAEMNAQGLLDVHTKYSLFTGKKKT